MCSFNFLCTSRLYVIILSYQGNLVSHHKYHIYLALVIKKCIVKFSSIFNEYC